MDQNKTNIPNLCPTPKAVQTVFRLQTHCTGVLAHTRSHKGKKAYALYDICQWPQDVNLTLHALLHVLLDFVENLPEVLYLQLDNAGNQNKNRYLLGFCALLVEKKIFRKVQYYIHLFTTFLVIHNQVYTHYTVVSIGHHNFSIQIPLLIGVRAGKFWYPVK